jgi:hypothetical protein
MHTYLKYILFIFSFSLSLSSNSQTNLVSVVATGGGPTESLATNRALRNAIEKTFGVFISSSTQISNDELIKDEIATVASGNIASYETISVINVGSDFLVTISAQVSPERLVFNLKNMGHKVEIQGNIFAQNVLKEKFYKDQEVVVIKDFIEAYKNIWIIDDFLTIACDPFFMNLGAINKSSFQNALSGEEDFRTILFNNQIRFDGLYDEANLYTYYIHRFGPYKSEVLCLQGGKWISQEQTRRGPSCEFKNSEFYILPIVFKPIYNSQNALLISKTILGILQAISIKDLKQFSTLMGNPHLISLSLPIDEKIKKFQYNAINKKKSAINFLEGAQKVTFEQFYLRNDESITLLKSFMNKQFIRTSLGAVNLKNKFITSNEPHFLLTHQELKTTAEVYRNNTNILSLCSYNDGPNQFIYPSVLCLTLSLKEMEDLKKVEFEWKNN